MLAQLTKTEWEDLVRDVFRHWFDTVELSRHPLVELGAVEQGLRNAGHQDEPYNRAKVLREVLRKAIGAVAVEGESLPIPENPGDPKWMDRRWRHYNILSLSLQHPPGEVAARVGLALGGQYYRDQAKAYTILAELLRSQEGNPIDTASPAALSYPSGAIRVDDPFYVKRDVDTELVESLSHLGDTVTIRGPRQVGKSSLLFQGIHYAKRRLDARVVYFDLQSVSLTAIESLDQFLRAIADWFGDELELDPGLVETVWNSSLPAQRKLTKLIERHILPDSPQPVLLAIDEADRLQLTPYATEFFGLIRSWHNRRASHPVWQKLTVILAISTEPYLLIEDLNQSPFNVGHVLRIKDFDAGQVAGLNDRYGRPVKQEDQSRMMEWLNGHPYLTRVALYTMVVDHLAWRDVEEIATSDQGPFHQHLQFQHRLLIRDDKLRNAFKEIIHTNHCSDETAAFRLVKAGLVLRSGNGDFSCRCGLYRRYFGGRL